MDNIKNYLKNNVVTFIVLLVIIMISLFIYKYLLDLEYDSESDKYQTIITTLASVVTSGAILIAVLQLSESQNFRKTQLAIVKQEKTTEMMKEFADILIDLNYILSFYNIAKDYYNIIEKHEHNNYRVFRMEEFKTMFTIDEQKKLLDWNTLLNKHKIGLIDLYYRTQCVDKDEIQSIKKFNAINWDIGKLSDHQEIQECKDLFVKISTHFTSAQWKTLNRLEWFSTYFNVGLADEDVAFQSLHQVYISTVYALYPKICEFNDGPITNHYYRNVINLYVRWSSRLHKNQMKLQNDEIKEKKKNEKIKHLMEIQSKKKQKNNEKTVKTSKKL